MKTTLSSSKIELMCECSQPLLNNIRYGPTMTEQVHDPQEDQTTKSFH